MNLTCSTEYNIILGDVYFPFVKLVFYCSKLSGRLSTASPVVELTSTPSLPKIQASAHQLLLIPSSTISYHLILISKFALSISKNSEIKSSLDRYAFISVFLSEIPKMLKIYCFFSQVSHRFPHVHFTDVHRKEKWVTEQFQDWRPGGLHTCRFSTRVAHIPNSHSDL